MKEQIEKQTSALPKNDSSHVIDITGLKKSFGDIKAVDDISFHVKTGELFAFLGENGAGKSTTISILCGQLSKDAGTVVVNGTDLDRNIDGIKRDIGVVFQNSKLDSVLTVQENLTSRAAMYGIRGDALAKRLSELDEMLSLNELYKRTVGKLSGGQRRRADIARALLHKPKILILDEPTTGLDPQTRKTVWKAVEHMRKVDNLTVFLTTHYMEEAAEADYVVILDQGKISAHGTPLELKNTYTGDYITVYGATEETAQTLGLKAEKVTDGYRFEVKNTAQATEIIKSHPELFVDYEVTKGKMDDVFLAVTGKKLVGGEK